MIRARDKSRLQISDAKVVALSLLYRLVYKLKKCALLVRTAYRSYDMRYEDEAYILHLLKFIYLILIKMHFHF